MPRRSLVSIALALVIVIGNPQPAAACSAGPDFDPRDHTQLLVLGQVRSLDFGVVTNTRSVEALVTLDVIRLYRGSAPSPLRFVDRNSVFVERDPRTGREERLFSGGSGACGTIDEDPVGRYVLIALARGEDSRWHANRLYGAIYSDALDYTAYRWLLERHGVPVPFLVTGLLHESLPGPAFAP